MNIDNTVLYLIIAGGGLILLSILFYIIYRIRSRTVVFLTDDEKLLINNAKFGKYEIKSFLTRGHFSTTFEAYDTLYEKPVALRIFKKELMENEEAIRQFKLKTKTLKYLSDNFPSKYLIGNAETGEEIFESELRPYCSTQLLDGVSLDSLLKKQKKLSPADSNAIIQQIWQVVSLAHTQRILIHEITPANIFLTLDESKNLTATLTDIGIPYGDIPFEELKNGKRSYYSAEQVNGAGFSERSDVYALSALMFRMINGTDPSTENIEAAEFVSKTLNSGLSPDPEGRPATVVELVLGLNEIDKVKSDIKDLNWELLIPRLASLKIKYKDLKLSADSRKYLRKKKRGFFYFLKYIFSIFALGLAKLWEWWFQPKKVIITLLLIVVALGIWAYFAFTKVHGTIVVNVRELSAIFPPREIPEILVHVEAHDRVTGALISLEYETPDESIEPQESKILLRTNSDGIAVANYSGRFSPENAVIQYKVIINNTKYVSQYIETSVSDTGITKGRHISTIKLRPIVQGQIPVLASLKGLPLSRGDKPPETFKLDVYLVDAEGNPATNAKLYLKADEKSKDSSQLEFRGGSFVLKENPFKDEPYFLSYIVNDSTKISIKLIIEPEGQSKFKFDNKGGKPAMISKGGVEIEPVQPTAILDEASALQYKFMVFDEAGNPLKGIKFYIQASDVVDEEDKDILITNEVGEVMFPEKPIQDIERFWTIMDKDGKTPDKTKTEAFEYKIWIKIPGEPYPRDETRNVLVWKRPAKPEDVIFKIELNLQTMQIDFLK